MFFNVLPFVCCVFMVGVVDSARILTVFPVVAKSHFTVGQSLSTGLAKAGHDVTMITPYHYKTPVKNLKVLQLTGALEIAETANQVETVDEFYLSAFHMLPYLFIRGKQFSRSVLMDEKVIQLMDGGSFDLIIVDVFCTEATIGLGQHFSAPVIGVSGFGASTWTNDLVGNPAPLSYVPHAFSTYSSGMSLWQRIGNTITLFYEKVIINLMNYPYQKDIYEEAFPNAKISYDESVKSVSLVLVNSHFSINGPRPYVPNMIEVGGMHVERVAKRLPKNIQLFLNSAKDGVIFFSLGSILKSSLMPTAQTDIFIKVFGSLKQRVIWKFEGELDVPSNIMISSWLPQSEIFAHPNVKLFITHGGLLSTIESIYHGLPVIGMPFFCDQDRNVEGFVSAGWAIRLDYSNLTEESLLWAINEMLTNSKYADNARLVSERFRDQPLTPLETAIYWTEYVIRHGGAPHLRSASMNLKFVEYHNIDALFILSIVTGAFVVAVLFSVKWCFKKCFARRPHTKRD